MSQPGRVSHDSKDIIDSSSPTSDYSTKDFLVIHITHRVTYLGHLASSLLLALLGLGLVVLLCLLIDETSDAEVVDDLFHLLHVVLERVELFPEAVVLEVEQPESGEEVAHKC